MAKKNIIVSVPAGTEVEMLTDWNWETPPMPGRVKLNMWCASVGLLATLSSLDTTIFQRSAVSGAAPANKVPSDNDIDPIIEAVPGNRKLSLSVFNPTGGALTFLATIEFVAGSGRRK